MVQLRLYRAYTVILGLFPVMVLFMVGCGSSKQLSRAKAADLLPSCPNSKKPLTVQLQTGGQTFFAYADFRAGHKFEADMESAGLIEIRPGPCSGTGTCAWVALSPKWQHEAESWNSRKSTSTNLGAPWIYYDIPLAKMDLFEVTGISATPDGADVEFSWKWIPASPALPVEYFKDYVPGLTDAHTSSVGMKLYDDGWRCMTAAREVHR